MSVTECASHHVGPSVAHSAAGPPEDRAHRQEGVLAVTETWNIINLDGDRDAIEHRHFPETDIEYLDVEWRSLYYIKTYQSIVGWWLSSEYVEPERHGLIGGVHSDTPWDDDWWTEFPDMPEEIAERAAELQERM